MGCARQRAVLGQDIDDYRRDLAVQAKRLLPDGHELRNIQYRRLPADAFNQFEPQLLAACRDSARRPDAVPQGQLRRFEDVDGNGLKVVSWVGRQSFVHDFTRPGRRVTSFRTSTGYVDARGRPLA
jgi:hypothetical protein